MHDGEGHCEDRTPLARQLQIVESADPFALGSVLVANQRERYLGLKDLIAALVGEAQRQGRDPVVLSDNGDLAEHHPCCWPGEPREHQSCGDAIRPSPNIASTVMTRFP